MWAFLLSMFVLLSAAARAGGPPRLAVEVPTNLGCERLLKYSRPDSRIAELNSKEAADELADLLRLSHPLVIIYLSQTDFHGDLRLLSLIWGDQYEFDLRPTKFLVGHSPFEIFMIRASNWEIKDLRTRRHLANSFLSEISNIRWTINREISSATIYTGNHRSDSAFQTDRPLWMSDFPRHWDVNDDFNIALRLHETIHALRTRLNHDRAMARRMRIILTEKLPLIANPTTQFLEKYVSYLVNSDPDNGLIKNPRK